MFDDPRSQSSEGGQMKKEEEEVARVGEQTAIPPERATAAESGAIRAECVLCEGDGFGTDGGNCPRCNGGGKEPL